MALSIQKRWEIIFLHKHPHGPKWTVYKISQYLHISRNTVQKWIDRYEETEDIHDLPGRGRKKKTTPKTDQAIVALFEKDKNMNLTRARALLESRNIRLSISTISRRLHEAGYFQKMALSKPLLTLDHMKKRLLWCEQVAEVDWNKVIFSDEATFWIREYKKKYWGRVNDQKVIRTVKHPQKVHVWGCFSAAGFGKLFIFKEILIAKLLVKIYRTALLPSMKQFGFDEDIGWLFQEDNDPKHTSKMAKKWKISNTIPMLPWSSNSPDLSPIENLWAIMKTKISERRPKKMHQLVALIYHTWKHFSLELAHNLVNSMPQRIQSCIEAKGDFTLY